MPSVDPAGTVAARDLGGVGVCSACGQPVHDPRQLSASDSYAYLLGIYLGDGWLAKTAASTSIRIAMDERYTGIIDQCCAAIEDVRWRPPSVQRRRTACVEIVSYWKQWPCLFPQHGPGRKHHRPIVLAGWQRDIVRERPEPLIRGLIHSDGWRGLNKVTVKGRDYAYPRYQFSNRSQDIKDIFTAACDSIGVEWRRWGQWHISVAKRDSVARLDRFIGPKC